MSAVSRTSGLNAFDMSSARASTRDALATKSPVVDFSNLGPLLVLVEVIAEESGFLGAGSLLFLYVLMILLMMMSASGIRDRFSRLVVGGIALYFSAHVFINVSVNLGLLPMTGLTLPLVSYGRSNLIVTLAGLGFALRAHHELAADHKPHRRVRARRRGGTA